jgi:hypothetical protein
MTHRTLALIAATTLLGACGFAPEEGTWLYTTDDVVQDTCGGEIDQDPGDFELFVSDDGDLIIDPDDGTDPFQCTLSGRSFTCPERAGGEEEIEGFDAELSYVAVAEGTFSSPDEATGSQTGTVDCTGADCDPLAALVNATFPCTVEETFTIVFSN